MTRGRAELRLHAIIRYLSVVAASISAAVVAKPDNTVKRLSTFAALCCVLLVVGACAPAPVTSPPPVVTWEQKLDWILRLEEQRLIRNPDQPPPVVLVAATRNQPAVVAPAEPSDLVILLADDEARVRRRAALALGRVGLPEAVEPLGALLADPEMEVRQMAAFALGLIEDPSAREGLVGLLNDSEPVVQGRAAEALGRIGEPGDAGSIAGMVLAHVKAGALSQIAPDDLTYPLASSVEAVRLGIFALVQLGDFDAVGGALLDADGRAVSTWWPVAYALQRVPDRRSESALISLLGEPRFTAAFAARGLAAIESQAAVRPLRQVVEERRADSAVVIQAVRALGTLGDSAAAGLLEGIARDQSVEPSLREEAMTAFGAIATRESVDVMLDLVSDPAPAIRAVAMRALARLDPDSFLGMLSGLDPDRDWTVREAQAAALGTLQERGLSRLALMLDDRDQRVVPAVLSALVEARAPDAQRLLLEHLAADDFGVRAAAAVGLAEMEVAEAVPALIGVYRTEGDSTYVARAAALAALASLDPAAARPVLEEALADREWAVRVRAEALLVEQGLSEALAARPAPTAAGVAIDRQELLSPQFSPHAFLDTDRGTIEIELAITDAPLTVANFVTLATKGFFNGTAIHRVVPDFVMQAGDPRGDGQGGAGTTLRDEINQRPYLRGTVGMALDWEDTGGSQFFITHSPQPHLDGRYTVFGQVVSGMEVVDQLRRWDLIRRVRIWDGVTER